MGIHRSMMIDKETDIFLKNRIKSNSKLHHLLDPVELRTERLRQLREDNLTPPKIYNSENLKIKNRFNKDRRQRQMCIRDSNYSIFSRRWFRYGGFGYS